MSSISALIISVLILSVAVTAVSAQDPPIDSAAALQYFHDAEAASKLDAGKLWGKPLYGPMLFVDPSTRKVVANVASPEGVLTREGDVYVGTLPTTISIANYAVEWAGVHWTMVIWQMLPKDPYDRLNLLMHESFHREQNDLGFAASDPTNDHLDSMDGRYWLQLEWRALRAALNSTGSRQRSAIDAALTFRAYRRSLFAGSGETERELEMNEGLAEYTGAILASQGISRKVLIGHVTAQMDLGPKKPTFVRSFAYITGPAYGILLDEFKPEWRRSLKREDDISQVLQRALRITISGDVKAQAEKLATRYDGEALRTSELARDEDRKKRIAGYKARLVDGPTLTIPVTSKHQRSFNPNTLIPYGAGSTIYPTVHIIDSWGILDVTDGALLIGKNGMMTSVVVALPPAFDSKKMEGDGWTLKLESGWSIEPTQKAGCYELKMGAK